MTRGHASRAEFIRLQCAASQLDPKAPERDRLDRKSAALFTEHGWKWYGRPSQPAGWRAGRHELLRQFDRGLLTELRVTGRLAHLIADLPGLFAVEPIGCLRFGGGLIRADHLRAVRRFAVPPRPVRLAFQPGVGGGEQVGYVVTALSSPLASAAVAVDAASCVARSALALVLARSPFLGSVRQLVIDSNQLDFMAALILANSPGLRNVEHVSARGNVFGPSGEDLLRRRFGPRLTV